MSNTTKRGWIYSGAEVIYVNRLGQRSDVVIIEIGDDACYVERENGECLWVPMIALREG